MIDKDWEDRLMQNTFSHGTGLMRMSLNKSGGIDVDVVDPKDYRHWIREPQISINTKVVGHVEPQREWIGLTDEEIIDVIHPLVMADMTDQATDYAIARAIEAKLKEKNT